MLFYLRPFWRRKTAVLFSETTEKKQFSKLLLFLLGLLVLHTVAMMFFEKMSLGNALWISITTATTVGYGDLSATTLGGRISTVLLLYIGGITILAQVAGTYFELVQTKRKKKIRGEWNWKMNNHLVFLNAPNEAGDDYFYQLVQQLRKSQVEAANLPIVIVSKNFSEGLSSRLREKNMVHVSKDPTDWEALEAASIENAKFIVLMAPSQTDPISDSLNFDLTCKLRQAGIKGVLIAEVLKTENRERFLDAGVNHVIRPIRSYPELLVRTILSPGSEQVIEDLFDSNGEECIRYNIDLKAEWGCIIKSMVDLDIGTPLSYESKDGKVFSNARPEEVVDTAAVFVIVREGNLQSQTQVQAKVSHAIATDTA